jgi:hypothetical protein
MSQLQVADNNVAADTEAASSAYVPPLQRTAGQPPPIAAHGGLSYMAFSRNGDAGTTVALEDARTEIGSGEEQRLIDMIDNAPPGPIETRWGLGFRGYDECMAGVRPRAGGVQAIQIANASGQKDGRQIGEQLMHVLASGRGVPQTAQRAHRQESRAAVCARVSARCGCAQAAPQSGKAS